MCQHNYELGSKAENSPEGGDALKTSKQASLAPLSFFSILHGEGAEGGRGYYLYVVMCLPV